MQQYPFDQGMPRFDTRMVVIAVLVVISLATLYSSYYQIEPGEKGVVLRFGKLDRTMAAGPHFKMPWPVETLLREQVAKIRLLQIGYREYGGRIRPIMSEAEMLTRDKNIVVCPMNVQYSIKSLHSFLFHVREVEEVIRDAAEAALREVIGRHPIDDALSEKKDEIEIEIREEMDKTVNSIYNVGIHIRLVQLRDVRVPDQVVESFRDVTSAKEDSSRSLEQAYAYRNRIMPKAQSDSIRLYLAAQAYAGERIFTAQGDSARFVQIYRKYRRAPKVTETRMYIETMEKVLRGRPKYIIETDPRSLVNVLPSAVGLGRTLEGGSR